MIATWNKLLESSSFGNEPWFPYHEWNIDFSELTVGSRVGIGIHYYLLSSLFKFYFFCCYFFNFGENYIVGFFGEVFRGTWNGIEVAIKVLLEQEVTAENIEDFCNEISILRYLSTIYLGLIAFRTICLNSLADSLLLSFAVDFGTQTVLHFSKIQIISVLEHYFIRNLSLVFLFCH